MAKQKVYWFIRPTGKESSQHIAEFLEKMGGGQEAKIEDSGGQLQPLLCAKAWKDVKYLLDSKRGNAWLRFDIYIRRGNSGRVTKWPFGLKRKKTIAEKKVVEKLEKVKKKKPV